MKLLWRMGRSAARYKGMYVIAILATLGMTAVNLIAPRLMSQMTGLVERGLTREGLGQIGVLAACLGGLYLLRILFRFLSNYFAHVAAWNLVEELRVKVYDKIQSLSMRFFHDKQTGDLMSRVVNDTDKFELLYAHIIPETLTALVTILGVMFILLATNVKLALMTCIPVPFILASGWVFAKKVRPNFRKSQQATAMINAKLQDNFSGIREIQSFSQEEYESRQVEEKAHHFTTAMLHALKISAVFHPSVEFLSSIGSIIVVAFGGYLAWLGQVSLADIVAFMLYLSLFYTPITNIARLLEDMQQAYAGAERVIVILDEEQDVREAPGAMPLKDVKGGIAFEHVDFMYENGVPILEDICFSCEPGQMVALVGPTGVGKTTLTQLLSRFYDPQRGRILIDGVDISTVTLPSLRQSIAPVRQETYLFNGTIAQNIAYSVQNADFEAIVSAAKAARIHESIMEMPQGYDTQVGERGLRLSGGQKQRVAIARAILRNAPIIVLDEATASVDTKTEKEIQGAINELARTRTIVAIAHRLSTIQSADLILVLEEGRIVQQGTHAQLLEQEGLYRRLYAAQG